MSLFSILGILLAFGTVVWVAYKLGYKKGITDERASWITWLKPVVSKLMESVKETK